VPVELADCLIRILDICAAYDIDIESVISVKMKYNAMREYRHGGKRC
jgi:NTP pyrophosphatase (non-canonical NTP hydrolase)